MNKLRLVLTAIIILGAASFATAQSLSSSGSRGGGSGAPIDGGITLLVGGIAAYGAKKIRDNHKKTQAQPNI